MAGSHDQPAWLSQASGVRAAIFCAASSRLAEMCLLLIPVGAEPGPRVRARGPWQILHPHLFRLTPRIGREHEHTGVRPGSDNLRLQKPRFVVGDQNWHKRVCRCGFVVDRQGEGRAHMGKMDACELGGRAVTSAMPPQTTGPPFETQAVHCEPTHESFPERICSPIDGWRTGARVGTPELQQRPRGNLPDRHYRHSREIFDHCSQARHARIHFTARRRAIRHALVGLVRMPRERVPEHSAIRKLEFSKRAPNDRGGRLTPRTFARRQAKRAGHRGIAPSIISFSLVNGTPEKWHPW